MNQKLCLGNPMLFKVCEEDICDALSKNLFGFQFFNRMRLPSNRSLSAPLAPNEDETRGLSAAAAPSTNTLAGDLLSGSGGALESAAVGMSCRTFPQ